MNQLVMEMETPVARRTGPRKIVDRKGDTLGNRVVQARQDAGLTQKQLAEIVGTKQNYISDIERDQIKRPSADMMERIARACHVSVEELLLSKMEMEGISNTPTTRESMVMVNILEDLPEDVRQDCLALVRDLVEEWSRNDTDRKNRLRANLRLIEKRKGAGYRKSFCSDELIRPDLDGDTDLDAS